MSIPRGMQECSLSEVTRDLLRTVEPYLVASVVGAAAGVPAVSLAPNGPELQPIDPFRVERGPFFGLLHRLAALTGESGGLPLPPWALYDCGMVPGAVFGFAQRAGAAPEAVREAFGVAPDDTRLVPLSLIVALPLLEAGAWHLYGLRAIEQALPRGLAEQLYPATLVGALTALQVRRATAVAGWRGEDLFVYARFAPLELVTAWTPGHERADVLTCRFKVAPDRLNETPAAAAPAGAPGSMTVSAEDPGALRKLQSAIESGRRFEITGPPTQRGEVPMREVGQ